MNACAWLAVIVRFLGRTAIAICLAIPLAAQAGGPMNVVNEKPLVYPNGGASLKLNLDQGPLGPRTNAQAVALIQNAIALWNGVGTSTLRLVIGPQLSTDYTGANWNSIIGKFGDGLNPVVFDNDGSITDALFGAGARNVVLGFAGSAFSGANYVEGEAVLNGVLSVSDTTLTIVFAHEIGHFFGLDHSQLDDAQGLATDDYVLMYPIAYRTLLSLHEDDAAAVTALYPSATADLQYGQLTGAFTTTSGTPILGANIWARENATGQVYSVVSDFLVQGNGYFRLYLPPGTYTLNAESIHSAFTGGSWVGPYAYSSTDASFQAPHPITPVALGGRTPQAIVITAGCVATATFHLDGSGNATGCSVGSPVPTTTTVGGSPNPSTVGTAVTLTATVAGNAPTGTVSFTDGGTAISGCGAVALTGSGNSRKAACTTGGLNIGSHAIVARYGGETSAAGNQPSTGSMTLTVANAPGTFALTVVRTGSGTVTRNPAGIDCGTDCQSYVSGTGVSMIATPAGGSAFSGWSNACTGKGVCSVAMSGAKGVTAAFVSAGTGSASANEWVQKVYVAYYGRPADPAGQGYWAARMDKEGGSLSSIMAAFGTSDEFNRRYGGLSYSALIDMIYQQTLGRAPDAAGKSWYLSRLNAGLTTPQSITLDVLGGATGVDALTVANRLDVANHYTGKVVLGCAYGTETTGTASLRPVTSDAATVWTAKVAIESRCGP